MPPFNKRIEQVNSDVTVLISGGARIISISWYFPDPPDSFPSFPPPQAPVSLGFGILLLYDFISHFMQMVYPALFLSDVNNNSVEGLATKLNIAHDIPSSMEDSFSHLIRN
jgi:hypothetical protein